VEIILEFIATYTDIVLRGIEQARVLEPVLSFTRNPSTHKAKGMMYSEPSGSSNEVGRTHGHLIRNILVVGLYFAETLCVGFLRLRLVPVFVAERRWSLGAARVMSR